MKELWKIFEKDISSENFSTKEKVVYGILLPVGCITVAILGGLIE